jgi:hypothetical protein
MKNYLKIIIAVLVVALLSFIIWKAVVYKEPAFKTVILNPSNLTRNYTDMKYLDTIVRVGLNELNMKDIGVIIRPMGSIKNLENFKDLDIEAYIVGSGKIYTIYIKNSNRSESITIISHELIHLLQSNTNQLVIDKGVIFWMGEEVDIKKVPYAERPWEIEAFSKEGDLKNKIESKLY